MNDCECMCVILCSWYQLSAVRNYITSRVYRKSYLNLNERVLVERECAWMLAVVIFMHVLWPCMNVLKNYIQVYSLCRFNLMLIISIFPFYSFSSISMYVGVYCTDSVFWVKERHPQTTTRLHSFRYLEPDSRSLGLYPLPSFRAEAGLSSNGLVS